ncbi:hypothetical protein DL93DRAFT_2224569 [Clavulina sp. PMI_390]|nr:hypothetical protein DL93DRAFT_2224569 [Clavulina sp. PMI_390]
MLADESIWATYFEAQENLIATILSATPPAPHILSVSGPDRETLRSSTRSSMDHLDRSIERIEASMTNARSRLQKAQNLFTASLAPVEGLPLELLQSIINIIVDSSHQTSRIDWFRDISCQWRLAIQGLPHLFVDADWKYWSANKIRGWASLARCQPVSASIEADHPASQESLPSWGLETEICPREPPLSPLKPFNVVKRCQLAAELALQLGTLQAITPLLACSLPNLYELVIFSGDSQTITFPMGNMPNLSTFHCCGIQPASLVPSSNITNLGVGLDPELIRKVFDNFADPTTLTHLSLYRQPEPISQWSVNPFAYVMEHLTSLRLHGFTWGDRPALQELAQALDAPSLTSLEISTAGNFIPSIMTPLMAANITTLITLLPSQLLPNLKEIVVTASLLRSSSLELSSLDDWDVQQCIGFLQQRKGRMKRLMLPVALPKNICNQLIQAGELEEIGLSEGIETRSRKFVPFTQPVWRQND